MCAVKPESASNSRALLLVRHCQAISQSPTAALTDVGLGQAERLADFLSGYPVDFIVTSRYARARQTIEPYSEKAGLPIHQDHRLNERILSIGPRADWRRFVRRSFDDPDLRAPGGESARQALCRAAAALKDILHGEHRLPVVVTHGNVLALLLHSVDASFGYRGWKSLTNPDVWILNERPDGSRAFQRAWRA